MRATSKSRATIIIIAVLTGAFYLTAIAQEESETGEQTEKGSTDTPAPESPETEEASQEESSGKDSSEGETEEIVEEDDERVSLNYTDARIQDVLRSLASMREGVNMVMDEEVKGEISIKLDNVPWQTALDLVTQAQGLTYTKTEDNIYKINKEGEEEAEENTADSSLELALLNKESIDELSDQEIRNLLDEPVPDVEEGRKRLLDNPKNYIRKLAVKDRTAIEVVSKLAEEAELNYTFSATGKDLSDDQDNGDISLPTISVSLRNLSVEDVLKLIADQGRLSITKDGEVWVVSKRREKKEPLRLETFKVDHLSLDEQLVETLEGLISDRGIVKRGKNKVIIVNATKDGIEAIRQTLMAMDTVTPQVLIEARIFQLTRNNDSRLGINWQNIGTEKGARFSANPDDLEYDYYNDVVLTDPRKATLSLPQFEVILHALKEEGGAEEVANPTILVRSGEQAMIHIGEQKPIVKSEFDTTGDGEPIRTYELDPDYGGEVVEAAVLDESKEGTQQQRQYTTNKGYLDLGTKLNVLPSVKADNMVLMHIVPELMSLIEMEEFGGGEVQYPRLFRTYVRTQSTVKDGQTIAIGGLVSRKESNDVTKVPLLGDIPIMGRLFRYDRDEMQESETVIFLTVHIMQEGDMLASSGIPSEAEKLQEKAEELEDAEKAEGASYGPAKAIELIDEYLEETEQTDEEEIAEKTTEEIPSPKSEPAEGTGEEADDEQAAGETDEELDEEPAADEEDEDEEPADVSAGD